MFCSNCGKNCGDANFCAVCGTRLQQSAARENLQTEWKVGMPCPHCGGTKLEGDSCAFCGAQLIADVPERSEEKMVDCLEWEDVYYFPYREFYHNGQLLALHHNGISVGRKLAFSKEMTRITFDELDSAEFTYFGGGLSRMLFTTKGKRLTFEASGENNCALDYIIFFLIYHLCNTNTEFYIEVPDMDADRMARLGKDIDLRSYFDRYCPLRATAAAALSREHKIPKEEAGPLIDVAFYTYQRELYEKDPILAARDYHRQMEERRWQSEKSSEN